MFSLETTLTFSFLPPFCQNGDKLLKERIVDPFLEGILVRGSKQEVT